MRSDMGKDMEKDMGKDMGKDMEKDMEKDKEKIWRLAFTFSLLDLNFDKFIYYYIKEKDSWYLYELFSVITDEKFDDKKLYEYVSKNYNDCLDTFIQAIKDYYGMDYEGYKE